MEDVMPSALAVDHSVIGTLQILLLRGLSAVACMGSGSAAAKRRRREEHDLFVHIETAASGLPADSWPESACHGEIALKTICYIPLLKELINLAALFGMTHFETLLRQLLKDEGV
ncbi:hypothetical protein KIPB_001940 [Kipferlia bialata]|uniref:Uncharacterized protein n=1 Tax=Kipferlia bialata TaxID=797122 RepID=A0A9K3CPM7_9EUKA|nr:hypothetical protein KIPB_001940 [Kipferlia bialata]|eukprot:g1940.t1